MSRRAFSLVEVLAASVLLGAALASILGIASSGASAQGRGERLATAAALADEQLELVLALGVEGFRSEFPMEGSCDPPFDRYLYEIDVGSASGSDAVPVSVTITWMDGSRTRSLTVDTLIAPYLGEEPDPERRPETPIIRDFGF